MAQVSAQYEKLSTRQGFNLALRHFQQVNEIVEDLEDNINLADQVNDLLAEKVVEAGQIQPILNALLVDRYGYAAVSHNLETSTSDFSAILAEVRKWTAVDLVVAYYSPELGLTLIDPKNEEHWRAVQSVKKTELITVYCGAFSDTERNARYEKGAEALVRLLEGGKGATPKALTGGRFKAPVKKAPVQQRRKAPPKRGRSSTAFPRAKSAGTAAEPAAPQAAAAPPPPPPAAGSVRMTPLYGVVVTNELFHNGNVEAWKKIIQSYEHSHAGLRVNVYYEGEKIHDINTLFKWGKVKRGTPIMISVQGEDIRDVAKLQRYLRQGASHLFEAFLKGAPGQILNLF
jgi:hypothetical protein